MAAVAPPPTPAAPPVPPGIDPSLNNYLQQFSLWAQNNFATTLSNNQGLPGVLLSANDAAAGVSAATYQLGVDSKGELETRLIASGSGAPGAWTEVVDINAIINQVTTGVTDGSDAAAGKIGEYVTVSVGGAVSNGVTTVIGTMSLTAGDWDVEGTLQFQFSAGGVIVVIGVSTTGAFPSPGQPGRAQLNLSNGTIGVTDIASGLARVSFSATSYVYLVAQGGFSSGTCTVTGSMRARRMR